MMDRLRAALWTEALKARRSKVPVLTALGFSLAPLMGALFMMILKDPARARRWGLIGAKAQLTTGAADWPTLIGLLAQATAVGGSLLFALVAAWVFGREGADGTTKELLAVRTPREVIVVAKFAVVGFWCLALASVVWGLGLALGMALGLPGWSSGLALSGTRDLFAGALLTMALVTPVAFVASASRGYLGGLGLAILTLFLAQVVVAIGWGEWFPWSVPAFVTGLADRRALHPASYMLVAMTCCAGAAGTLLWWRLADHR